MTALRILIGSTPVGPLGSGIGGGVELTLHNLVLGLSDRGHRVEVMAPENSLHVGQHTHHIAGTLQPLGHLAQRSEAICIPPHSVLANMWAFAREQQHRFDVIVNLAYDWLPLYISNTFHVPIAHLVSMASITDAMDDAIEERLLNAPFSVAMHSKAQAETFALGHQARIIGSGVAVERYDFVQQVADNAPLGFIGRVSPEKGILDLFHIASVTKRHVKVWGLMQDTLCWEEARRAYPTAKVTYEGFLPTDQLQGEVGQCAAVLMTSKWVEAFGNVAIEAMACGVPVVSYRRGGPSEVILHGETGFLVEPDDIAGMVAALAGVPALSRQKCRTHVETEFSTKAFAVRSEMWLREAVRQFHAVS